MIYWSELLLVPLSEVAAVTAGTNVMLIPINIHTLSLFVCKNRIKPDFFYETGGSQTFFSIFGKKSKK